MHSKTEWQLIELFHLDSLNPSEVKEVRYRMLNNQRFAIRFKTFQNLFQMLRLYRRKQVKGHLDVLFNAMMRDPLKKDFQKKIHQLQKLQS